MTKTKMLHINTHHRNIIKLGLPIAVGQVGLLVQSFADTMMVGRYGTNDLAASAFVNNVMGMVMFLMMGYAFGITPKLSGYYGRGEHDKVGRIFKEGLVANLIFAAVIMSVMAVFYYFIDRMGQPPELLPLIRPYYITIWVSMAFLCVFNVVRQLTDGTLDTKSAMWILIISNAANILGNALLIYGLGPFPEWGVFGAGMSTLASRVLMAVLIIVVVMSRSRYAPYRKAIAATRVRWGDLPHIHRKSMPVALQMGLESATFTLCAIMAGWIGSVPLATYQVMVTMSLMGYLVYASFANSASIRIGTFAGQGDWASIAGTERAGLQIILVLATIVSIIYIAFGRPIVELFSSDPLVIAMAMTLIPAMIIYQYSDGIQVLYSGCLRGLSHMRSAMRLAFVGYLFIGMPLCYIVAVLWLSDVIGLFIGLSAGLAVSATLYHFRMRRAVRNKELG